MMTLHPAVRVPLLVLGGLAFAIGIGAVLLGLSAGANGGPALWRGVLSLALGVVSTTLARRAGRR